MTSSLFCAKGTHTAHIKNKKLQMDFQSFRNNQSVIKHLFFHNKERIKMLSFGMFNP